MRRALAIAVSLIAALPAHGQGIDAERRNLAALTAQEDALTARIGASRNTLSHLLAALELFNRDPPPPLIVSAADAKDAVHAMILAKAIVPELEARVRDLDVQAQSLAQLRRQAAEASGDLFEADSAMDDRQGRLDALTNDAALLAPPSARQALAAQQDALPAPTVLLAPADGPYSARFGGRLRSGLAAEGVAYRTSPGAEVRAPAEAVVAYAGPVNGWGQVVILRAGGGCHMVLSGLGKVTVTTGQSVAVATPVGTMPTDGQSPPELYFEVRLARGPVDPARLMNGGRATNVNATGLRLGREGVD